MFRFLSSTYLLYLLNHTTTWFLSRRVLESNHATSSVGSSQLPCGILYLQVFFFKFPKDYSSCRNIKITLKIHPENSSQNFSWEFLHDFFRIFLCIFLGICLGNPSKILIRIATKISSIISAGISLKFFHRFLK